MKRLILPLALLLLLSACSDTPKGDADPGSGEQPTRPSPAQAAQPTPQQTPAGSAGGGLRVRIDRDFVPYDPASFTLGLEPVLSGLRAPVFVTAPPDGSNRLFVVEQGGTIRVAENGRVLPQPFLDVSSLVVAGGERGLLGLAFHPRYGENGTFFIYYTARSNGDNTLARYRVSADRNLADPDSATVLFAQPDFAPNHNGGILAFGPDGYLYLGMGDGGGGNDPQRNGQNRGTLLGKVLRLDVDGGEPYGIPRDNPFVGQNGARPEVWAYGLRNPWRISFDRITGDLWIADVGQNRAEEINLQRAGGSGGENYGWPVMEGMGCLRGDTCDQSGLTLPVMEYDRDDGCSVTGGYVYRGSREPALGGGYFYADYCTGRIWSLHQAADGAWVVTLLLDTELQVSSFGEDEAGEVYLTDLRGGGVYRLMAQPR